LLKRFNDIMICENQILNCLAKEKERNAFLETELSKKEYRSIPCSANDTIKQKTASSGNEEQVQKLD